jgi:hypothetical protein
MGINKNAPKLGVVFKIFRFNYFFRPYLLHLYQARSWRKYKKGLIRSSPAPKAAPILMEPDIHHIKRNPTRVLIIL